MPTAPDSRAALAGVAAVAGGAGLAELATGALSLRTSPPLAVAEAVIALTPGRIAEFFIGLVGQADKPLLVTGVLLVLGALGAVAGVLATRRRGAGDAVLVALGVVGLVAVASRRGAAPIDAVPPLLGLAGSVVLLRWLLASPPPVGASDEVTRRSFLLRVAGVGAVAVVAAGSGRWLARSRSSFDATRRALKLPVRHVPVPAGVSVGVAGVSPWLTPSAEFYRIDTAISPPLLDAQSWRLRVHGEVDHPLDLSLSDLLARKSVDAWVTLCCVSNPVGGSLISNTRWTGVPIADVLAEAGVQNGADAVLSRSTDGWTCGTPLAALTDGRDALLAYAMDGQPLPVEHGYPVRMVVPGLYGYVSATKWVVDLEVTRFADFSAYWTDRGWSEQAPVKTSSRIDVPASGASVQAGQVVVAGVAWAQHRGIDAVEVRVDGGSWRRATLAAEPTIDTWRQWRWEWAAPPGDHRLEVRATDGSGAVQTGAVADVLPNGATGWHSVDVKVT